MNASKDAILGKLAVERGLITPEQLKQCVREQQVLPGDPNMTIGRTGSERPLSQILLARKFLTEPQLIELLDEQGRIVRSLERFHHIRNSELLFGQLLVRDDKATQNQINKCLEIQERRARRGEEVPRLGELLVEHGFVDAATIQSILKVQHKQILVCTKCGKQFNVIGVEKGKTYRCRQCGGIMLTEAMLESIKADETRHGKELEEEGKAPKGD